MSMLTNAPGCRTVCKGAPGEDMMQLVAAFKNLRTQGLTEAQALLLAADPEQVSAMLPGDSLGALAGTAAAIVSSGCAECAVNLAYAN